MLDLVLDLPDGRVYVTAVILAGASDLELILSLQQAVIDDEGWRGFLAQLASLTGATAAAMILRSAGGEPPTLIAAATPRGRDVRVLPAAGAAIASEAMRPERIYTTAEIAELGSGAGLVDILGSVGAVAIRAMRIATAEVPPVFLAVFGSTEFDAADGAILRRLYPHLQAAIRGAARVRRERSRAAVAAALVQAANTAWFLLDRGGLVVATSLRAGEQVPGLHLVAGPHGDRLALDERGAGADLLLILDGIGDGIAPRHRALRVSHDPAFSLRLSPWTGRHNPWMRTPVALAMLQGRAAVAPGLADLLVDLYGLLPSEARLAAALAGGDTLAAAAQRLGLTIETARNYSKKIFYKTGTGGQADLIRLIYSQGMA